MMAWIPILGVQGFLTQNVINMMHHHGIKNETKEFTLIQ